VIHEILPSQVLLRIKSCVADKDEGLTACFDAAIRPLSIHNIFNPSFYCDDDIKIFSFRAIVDAEHDLTSFVSIENRVGRSVSKIDANAYKKLNVPQLIDPKIVKIGNVFYLTFNSGWRPEGNDIFIMKIYPGMGAPKKIIYEGRKKQERNWAFFSEQGEIYALYWINPVKILKLKTMGIDSWEFEDHYREGTPDRHLPEDLTIGTQLSSFQEQYCFVAHKKRIFKNRKIYLGRFCTFDLAKKTITPGKYWLVHSLKSLLGARIKHNTNLFSCTYFSGLQASGDLVKFGYGINDITYGFSAHRFDEL